MNPFETRNKFIKQAGALTVGALLAACAPRNENPPSIIYVPLPHGIQAIEPNSYLSTTNFGFQNEMNNYVVSIDFGALQETLSHYQIETRFKEGNHIGIELLEQTFAANTGDGVASSNLLGVELVLISGGRIFDTEQNGVGEPLNSQAGENALSMILSARIISGFAQLAELRGDMVKGQAISTEMQYFNDLVSGDMSVIAQMNRPAVPGNLI